MKNLTWQNPEQLFVAQELINKVKSKCCGIKVNKAVLKENAHYYANSDDVKNLLNDIENLDRNNRDKFIEGNLTEIREEYSWEKLVDKHEKYFMSLLAQKR